MTRINCVPPEELTRQHLLAEWRELPRVFRLAERAYRSGRPVRSPEVYTLGSGHVTFFYKRLGWCINRWTALKIEMLRRGYEPTYEKPPIVFVPEQWWADWTPTDDALAANRSRIAERLAA